MQELKSQSMNWARLKIGLNDWKEMKKSKTIKKSYNLAQTSIFTLTCVVNDRNEVLSISVLFFFSLWSNLNLISVRRTLVECENNDVEILPPSQPLLLPSSYTLSESGEMREPKSDTIGLNLRQDNKLFSVYFEMLIWLLFFLYVISRSLLLNSI